MNNLKIIRINLILIGFIGFFICGLWYPFSISLGNFSNINSITLYAQLGFYWMCSIPCFVILALLYKSTLSKGNILDSFVKNLNISKKILFISLIVFLVGNVILMLLNLNDFAILYFIIIAVGGGVVSIFNFIINSINYVSSLENEKTSNL